MDASSPAPIPPVPPPAEPKTNWWAVACGLLVLVILGGTGAWAYTSGRFLPKEQPAPVTTTEQLAPPFNVKNVLVEPGVLSWDSTSASQEAFTVKWNIEGGDAFTPEEVVLRFRIIDSANKTIQLWGLPDDFRVGEEGFTLPPLCSISPVESCITEAPAAGPAQLMVGGWVCTDLERNSAWYCSDEDAISIKEYSTPVTLTR